MRHIILFCYMFAICFGIASITMVILAGHRRKSELNKRMVSFVGCMLVMSLYDLLIYYTDYIIGEIGNTELLRIGNCIIAVLFYVWLSLEKALVGSTAFRRFNRMFGIYTIAYVGVWMACTFLMSDENFYVVKWILLASDIALLLFALAGSVIYIGEAVWTRQRSETFYYIVLVTTMLIWNYASYFWGQTSVYWGNSAFIREPMDLTILFWFVVHIATLVMIYRIEFTKAYTAEIAETETFNLDRRLEELAGQYSLTARETELVKLIYEGNSNSEIAKTLFISESTVKTHIYNIFRKLKTKNRVGVICLVRGEDDEKAERQEQ